LGVAATRRGGQHLPSTYASTHHEGWGMHSLSWRPCHALIPSSTTALCLAHCRGQGQPPPAPPRTLCTLLALGRRAGCGWRRGWVVPCFSRWQQQPVGRAPASAVCGVVAACGWRWGLRPSPSVCLCLLFIPPTRKGEAAPGPGPRAATGAAGQGMCRERGNCRTQQQGCGWGGAKGSRVSPAGVGGWVGGDEMHQ
jgi:hypothetical protein